MMARVLAGAVLLAVFVALRRGRCSTGFVELAPPRATSGSVVYATRPHIASAETSRSSATASSSSGYGASGVAFVALAAAVAAGLSRVGQRRRGSTTCYASVIASRPDQAIPWWDRLVRHKIETGIGVWAEKLNMTQVFSPEGKRMAATILVIKRGGNIVTGKRWPESHGYYAVQVGYKRYVPEEWEKTKGGEHRLRKLGMLAAADLPPMQKLKEYRLRPQDWIKYNVGDKVVVSDLFKEGDTIDMHGISKNKGFTNSIKKWGHSYGPMAHGSKHHGRYGSMGPGDGTKRVFPGKLEAAWKGGHKVVVRTKILKIMDGIDEDNMPETIIVVEGHVPGYSAHWKDGGSFVRLNHAMVKGDGRYKADPVWLWYTKDENVDPYVPMKGKAWTWKTFWGRDIRWVAAEVKKYWPDGFPGYDHSADPFYDDCDERIAIKAPEW